MAFPNMQIGDVQVYSLTIFPEKGFIDDLRLNKSLLGRATPAIQAKVIAPGFSNTPIEDQTQRLRESGTTFSWLLTAMQAGHRVVIAQLLAGGLESGNAFKATETLPWYPTEVVVDKPWLTAATVNAIIAGIATVVGSSGFVLLLQAIFTFVKRGD